MKELKRLRGVQKELTERKKMLESWLDITDREYSYILDRLNDINRRIGKLRKIK